MGFKDFSVTVGTQFEEETFKLLNRNYKNIKQEIDNWANGAEWEITSYDGIPEIPIEYDDGLKSIVRARDLVKRSGYREVEVGFELGLSIEDMEAMNITAWDDPEEYAKYVLPWYVPPKARELIYPYMDLEQFGLDYPDKSKEDDDAFYVFNWK